MLLQHFQILSLFCCCVIATAASLTHAQNATTTKAPATIRPVDPVVGVSGTLEPLEQNSRIPTSFVAAILVVAALILIIWIDKFFPPTTIEDLPGRERRLAMLKPPRAWTIPDTFEDSSAEFAGGAASSSVAPSSVGRQRAVDDDDDDGAGDRLAAPLLHNQGRSSPRDATGSRRFDYNDHQQQQQEVSAGRRSRRAMSDY